MQGGSKRCLIVK